MEGIDEILAFINEQKVKWDELNRDVKDSETDIIEGHSNFDLIYKLDHITWCMNDLVLYITNPDNA